MKCKCGAKWRVNYPFGRKDKARVTFISKHKDGCPYIPGNSKFKKPVLKHKNGR